MAFSAGCLQILLVLGDQRLCVLLDLLIGRDLGPVFTVDLGNVDLTVKIPLFIFKGPEGHHLCQSADDRQLFHGIGRYRTDICQGAYGHQNSGGRNSSPLHPYMIFHIFSSFPVLQGNHPGYRPFFFFFCLPDTGQHTVSGMGRNRNLPIFLFHIHHLALELFFQKFLFLIFTILFHFFPPALYIQAIFTCSSFKVR